MHVVYDGVHSQVWRSGVGHMVDLLETTVFLQVLDPGFEPHPLDTLLSLITAPGISESSTAYDLKTSETSQDCLSLGLRQARLISIS